MRGTRLRGSASGRIHEASPECPRIFSRLLKRAPRVAWALARRNRRGLRRLSRLVVQRRGRRAAAAGSGSQRHGHLGEDFLEDAVAEVHAAPG